MKISREMFIQENQLEQITKQNFWAVNKDFDVKFSFTKLSQDSIKKISELSIMIFM